MRAVAILVLLAFAGLVAWLLMESEDATAGGGAEASSAPVVDATEAELDHARDRSERVRAIDAAPAIEDDPAEEQEWPTHLARAGGIVLEVVDAKGTPRANVKLGVELELWRLLGHEHEDKYQHQDIVTDSAGRAPIAATHPDEIEYVMLLRDDDPGLSARGPFELVPGSSGIVRLVLPTNITVRGRVVDTAGVPIDGVARIELEPKDVEDLEPGLHRFVGKEEDLRTGEDGRFVLEIVPGWYTLGAGRLGHDVFERATLHVLDEPSEHELELRVPVLSREVLVRVEPASVDVWVVARAEGVWPTVANAGAIVARRREPLLFRADRSSNSTWSLKLAPGCEYTVTAGRRNDVGARAVLPENVNELALVLESKPPPEVVTLRGRAVDAAGVGLRGTIRLLRSNDLGRFAQEETDADGEFEFTLPRSVHAERSAVVFGEFREAGSALLGPLAIDRSRDDLVLAVQVSLAVEGRIEGVDEKGADVWLRFGPDHFKGAELAAAPALHTRAIEGRYLRIGEDGRFRFHGLAPGEYELWVEPVQRLQLPARVAVRAGDRNVLVRLGDGLVGEVAFACSVIDGVTRAPVPNAEVSVRGPDSGDFVRGSSGRTGKDGRCELVGHARGTWFLDVRARDHARVPERFVEYGPGRHVIEIELSPRCALEVELVDAKGTPLAGIELAVTTRDGVLLDLLDPYGNWDGCITRTNVAGRARLTGLPMGPVRILAGWIDGTGPKELSSVPGAARVEDADTVACVEAELVHDRRVRARRVLR